jgi:hypothetical protein
LISTTNTRIKSDPGLSHRHGEGKPIFERVQYHRQAAAQTIRMTITYFDFRNEIPLSSEKIDDVTIRTASVSNFSEISRSTTLRDVSQFRPGVTFHIAQRGIGTVRFPVPSSELVTQVFHEDGTLAYTSTRAKKCSGNAVLSHSKLGDLISTTYFWGPGRPPLIKFLEGQDGSDTVKVSGKCISRKANFATPDGRVYEWSYASTKDANGKRVNILALREKNTGEIIAQLIRGEGSRTQGTSRCSAGNGGQLVLGQEATGHLDEALVVASCLVMLKKEIDRRRGVQMAVIAGVASAAC